MKTSNSGAEMTETIRKPSMRQKQAEATRQRIFDTAIRLVMEKGFENVTVDNICNESGVAKGGFYHHFSSKDCIVTETYRLLDERFTAAAEYYAISLEPRLKIEFTTDFMAAEAVQHGVVFCRQIYRSQLEHGTKFFTSPERPFYKLIHEAMEKARMLEEIRSPMSETQLTRMVLSLARGIIYDWVLHVGSYDIRSIMKQSTNTLMDGLFLA